MKLRYLAFSATGFALGERLASDLGGEVTRCLPHGLEPWTEAAFREAQGLIYIGAVGIAVRAIAPYLRSKTSDPAVVVVDEKGTFSIPILSGHLGGGNDLARRIAISTGAQAVITTATDLHGCFAVDEWAKRQGCHVCNPEKIKTISSRLLAGQHIYVSSDVPILGEPPKGLHLSEQACGDIFLSCRVCDSDALHLAPRIVTLGVGCRRGSTDMALEAAFSDLLLQSGLCEQAIVRVASIDLKADEPGLLAFCEAHGWPLVTYSADTLARLKGDFAHSEFVQQVTGVDNVCERAALLDAKGRLMWKKTKGEGVTMALAIASFAPDWRWQDG